MADGLGVMAGGSFYQEHSETQRVAGQFGLDLLAGAIADLGPCPDRPLIADFGAAQGRNSDAPLSRIISGLADAEEVVVVHTDLPGNDWPALFDHVNTDPTSYLQGHDNVRVLIAGGSFYDRLLPEHSLCIGWTSAAIHWLSRKPCGISDNFFVQSSTDEQAKKLYRDQSRRDWRAFLRHRAVEMRPNASLVFVDVLMDDAGSSGNEGLFDCVESALRWARSANVISDSEYASIAYPTWFRTLEDLRAPFPFHGQDGGTLELVSLERAQLEDPFIADYLTTSDGDAYAKAQIGFLKGFLGPSFTTALTDSDPSRLEPVWERARELISRDPLGITPTYRLVSGRIRMTSRAIARLRAALTDPER